jgi:hypothetical protein
MASELQGKTIAILAADSQEQVELEQPRQAVQRQAGRRDLPRTVDASRGRRGPGPHPDLLPKRQTDIRNAPQP